MRTEEPQHNAAFDAAIVPGERYHVDLVYSGVITDRGAVTVLCAPLQMPDRRLAVFVGRSKGLSITLNHCATVSKYNAAADIYDVGIRMRI